MESSDCRRRASDAEQPAPSCSVTVKCEPVMVKEEPEKGECGVSEAAAAEGLYADHEVNDELVIAPEQMQQLDITFSMRDVLNIKKENQHETKTAGGADAVAGGLYAGREVKYELDIGPELVQQQDITYSIQDVLNIEYEREHELKTAVGAGAAPGCTHSCPGEGPHCNRSPEQQYGLRSCFVRLERLPVGDLHISALCNVGRDNVLSHSFMPPKLKPAHCRVGTRRARVVPTSHQPHPSAEQSASRSDFPKYLQTYTHEKPHSCKICFKQFSQRSKLTRHILTHSAEKPYGCHLCSKLYTDKSSLTRHIIQTHSNGTQNSCSICKKRFRDQSTFTQHARVHTGERPFVCDMCGQRFKRNSHLQDHRRIHAGEKPYSCDVSDNRITAKATCTSHKVKRKAEKPYGCDVCKRRFATIETLTTHKIIHSGGKPYSCEVCNKRFRHKSLLTQHVRVHTDERPFGCDMCDERFKRKSHLKMHIRQHTGEKPYSCDVCYKLFTHKVSLTHHKLIHK